MVITRSASTHSLLGSSNGPMTRSRLSQWMQESTGSGRGSGKVRTSSRKRAKLASSTDGRLESKVRSGSMSGSGQEEDGEEEEEVDSGIGRSVKQEDLPSTSQFSFTSPYTTTTRADTPTSIPLSMQRTSLSRPSYPRSPTPSASGSGSTSTSNANVHLRSATGFYHPTTTHSTNDAVASSSRQAYSPYQPMRNSSSPPPLKRRRVEAIKTEPHDSLHPQPFGPAGSPLGAERMLMRKQEEEYSKAKAKISLESLPTSVISHILSFLPPPPDHGPSSQMPSQPHPQTLRTLLSLCLVGSRSLLLPAQAELYHCPYLPTRANAHKLHVAFHANPKLRTLVKRLEIDLDGMCEKREEQRAGRNSGNNVWLPWYLHQTLLFFSPILLSVSSLLSFSINLPSNASVYMNELNRVWGTWDTLLHFSKDLFPPDRSRGHNDPPNYPPREVSIPSAADELYVIYSPSPSASPALWPVRSLMGLLKEWTNIEYLAWRGLLSEYAPSLVNTPALNNGVNRWSEMKTEDIGKWLREVVLVDVAIGDDDLRGLIAPLPLRRFVLWRSSLVSRIGLRDAILTRTDGRTTKPSTPYDPFNPPCYLQRHKLQELVLGPGWWGTITTNNKPSVSADPAASYPLDEILAHSPELKHLYFEGDLMSVDCLKDAKIRWANPEGLETLVIKGCIGGSGGMGIWTPEKVTNAIAGWDTVKMRKPSSWNSEEANGNASEEDVLEFIPGRGRGMCKKLRLLLGGASRVGNPAGGLSLDWSDLQVRKVRDVAKLKNCEFRVKYGEIIIWKDEPAIS